MKKILSIIVLLTLIVSDTLCANAETIDVALDSVTVVTDSGKVDSPNILWNGTTYIPLRAVSESLGCAVHWEEESRTAQITAAPLIFQFNALKYMSDVRSSVTGSFIQSVNFLGSYYNSIIFNMANKNEFYQTALSALEETGSYIDSYKESNLKNSPADTLGYDIYLDLYICSNMGVFQSEKFYEAIDALSLAVDNLYLAFDCLNKYSDTKASVYTAQYGGYEKDARDLYRYGIDTITDLIETVTNSFHSSIFSSNRQ